MDEVGFSEELGDELGFGFAVEFDGCAELDDLAFLEERDFVGHGQGFFLVVGHIDGGDSRVFADVADLESEVVAEFGVEVGEGFV